MELPVGSMFGEREIRRILTSLTPLSFEGRSRAVYQSPYLSNAVVKVDNPGFTSNAHEWRVWNDATAEQRAWLAPSLWVNDDLSVLIMTRTQELVDMSLIIPQYLADADCHAQNWGMLDDRPVCHDYEAVNLDGCSSLIKVSYSSLSDRRPRYPVYFKLKP